MIDFTDLILENIKQEEGTLEIDIETPHGQLLGEIIVGDDRIWESPSYDSCDGLATLIDGDVDFDIELSLFDVHGDEITDVKFEINDTKIYEFLNQE